MRFRKPGDKHFSPAVVVGKHETPRSYLINDETGKEYRRNRRHIRLSQEPPCTVRHDFSIEPESDTKETNVGLPVTTESNVITELDPLSNDAMADSNLTSDNVVSGLRRSARTRTVP